VSVSDVILGTKGGFTFFSSIKLKSIDLNQGWFFKSLKPFSPTPSLLSGSLVNKP